MELTSPEITVSLPYSHFYDDLAARLTPEEESQVRLVHWTFKNGAPQGAEPGDIDLVVLPFHTIAMKTTEQYVSTHVLKSALATATRARLAQAPSIGIEGLEPCIPDGVVLSNAVGVMEQPTAELAVTLLLAIRREIPGFLESGPEWNNHRTAGLIGSRVLLLGYGGVGANVARMLSGFDVDIVRVARRARDLPTGEHVHGVDELAELLSTADAVVCTLPLTTATAGLVDADMLARLRDGATFVNVGQGAVVDTDALLAEAERGRLMIALDVTEPEPLPEDHPLWRLPNVLITPHVGGNSNASHRFQADLLVEQVRRVLADQTPRNIVHGEWSSLQAQS
ncbi:NAD(P)-dependent oxidoreductase [Georgenia sp. MJ170]|uniref:NAD(P)-dependent oxidoreductase n=1 Tax=Georgenia sunbinii TaxID=3117728 RepID=UPI002F2637AA